MGNTVNIHNRPVHLDLTRMKFPPMAIVSILHRVSGVVLFLLLPFVLYALHASLASQASFSQLLQLMTSSTVKFLLWLLISAVSFHFIAGIRHLLMDCGLGEGLQSARVTAYGVIVLAGMAAIFVGVWLW